MGLGDLFWEKLKVQRIAQKINQDPLEIEVIYIPVAYATDFFNSRAQLPYLEYLTHYKTLPRGSI